MERKDSNLIIVLVVVIGLFIFNGVVVKQVQNPLLAEILRQQDQMFKSMVRMESKLAFFQDADLKADLRKVTAEQQKVSERLAGIEVNLAGLQQVIKQGIENSPQAELGQQAMPTEPANTIKDIPIGDSVIIGSKTAPITIVEFMDIQCPYCARFHSPVMEAVAAFPDQVNVVVKNFPLSFHANARSAARAALAANEQGKYSEMLSELLKNAGSLNEATFKELAKNIGLKVDKFTKDLKDNEQAYEAIINNDISLGRKIGVKGTPSFYINGKELRSRDTVGIKSEIEQALSEKGEKDVLKAEQ